MPVSINGSGTIGGVSDFSSSNIALTDPEITGGIYLGGTGSDNYLDDYETGTWTPEYVGLSGGSADYQFRVGRYVKVGNQVTLFGQIQCNKDTLSGDIVLAGLPFTTSSVFLLFPAAYLFARRRWATAMENFGGEFNGNSTTIQLHKSSSNAGDDVAVTDSDMGTGTADNTLHISATYTTD